MAMSSSAPGRRVNPATFAATGDAVGRAVGFMPAMSSTSAGWNSLALFAWRGRCEQARFQPLAEPALVYHTGGASLIRVRNGRNWTERSSPGLLTVIPAGTPVEWDIRGDVHSYSVHLGAGFFSSANEEMDPREPLRFRCGVVDPLLAASISALAEELTGPAQRGSLYADAIAAMMALHLMRTPAAPSEAAIPRGGLSRSALRRTLELMESSVESGITLQSLAAQAGLSRTYFAEAFQKAVGDSPHRYLTQRRIARARTLLQNTALPLAQIALQCGFSNQAHFAQSFRTAVGTTPSRYRLAVQ